MLLPRTQDMLIAAYKDAIQEQDVQFTGNSAYDDQGLFYVQNPAEIDYVGEPSPLIDQAWYNLSAQRDFLLSEEEAKALWPNDYMKHWHHTFKGYLVGIDAFHTLHCLYYYPEYYHIKPGHEESAVTHRGHCIEQIRQYVMCNADLTPYGMRWYPNPGREYADSDVTHTCRNWDKIRDFTRERWLSDEMEAWSEFQ
ncbi:hypothetical protein GQ53DRAFT_877812 [Thozetella sp. PMI_491]|nr:hypothetical protein GQ53DRAFT_877812 [Thozetella sp. PMI_491]